MINNEGLVFKVKLQLLFYLRLKVKVKWKQTKSTLCLFDLIKRQGGHKVGGKLWSNKCLTKIIFPHKKVWQNYFCLNKFLFEKKTCQKKCLV